MARRSECKVFDYLAQTSAATQTRERISQFLQRSEKYKLTNAEKVQVINLSPSRPVELDGVILGGLAFNWIFKAQVAGDLKIGKTFASVGKKDILASFILSCNFVALAAFRTLQNAFWSIFSLDRMLTWEDFDIIPTSCCLTINDSLNSNHRLLEAVIVPEVENRMTDDEVNEFLNLVVELLPPCPGKSGSEDPMEEDQEAQ